MVPVPLYGTIAAGGTGITFPQLARGTNEATRFDGRLIKVAEDATALAYNTAVTVTGVHSATTTDLTVNSTSDIVTGQIIVVNASEKMLVRAVVSATVLTVTRGYQGTTAAAYIGAETVQYDPFGFVTGVDDGSLTAAGLVTVNPDFALAATVVGEPYAAGSFLMYPKGLSPDYLVQRINDVLRTTEGQHFWFPSLVDDSDMSANDLTNWAAVDTPTTRAFTTTGADVLYGPRALEVGTNALAEGATSNSFDVSEREALVVTVFVRVTAGSLDVILRNVTAGSNTRTIDALDERLYTTVWFTETVPADCEQMALRFLSDTATSTFFISGQVIVQSQHRRRYKAPSWLNRESLVKAAVHLLPGQSAEQTDSYISHDDYLLDSLGVSFLRSDSDVNPMWIEFANSHSYPIGLVAYRPFDELGGDGSLTHADKDYVALKAVANILRDRGESDWKLWSRMASDRARVMRYGTREPRGVESLTAV